MMNSKINIFGHDIIKTKIGAKEYKVSVFRNDKFDFQFNLSLQPSGKDNVLPTYQLTVKSRTIPDWTSDKLNVISVWINENEE